MKISKFKKLVEEVVKEIAFPHQVSSLSNISTKNLPDKHTIHLSHNNGKFIPVSLRDKSLLDYEFGKNNYGHAYDSDSTMRYFNITDVIHLLYEFNILLTDDD
jgi:hypothetical protein